MRQLALFRWKCHRFNRDECSTMFANDFCQILCHTTPQHHRLTNTRFRSRVKSILSQHWDLFSVLAQKDQIFKSFLFYFSHAIRCQRIRLENIVCWNFCFSKTCSDLRTSEVIFKACKGSKTTSIKVRKTHRKQRSGKSDPGCYFEDDFFNIYHDVELQMSLTWIWKAWINWVQHSSPLTSALINFDDQTWCRQTIFPILWVLFSTVGSIFWITSKSTAFFNPISKEIIETYINCTCYCFDLLETREFRGLWK